MDAASHWRRVEKTVLYAAIHRRTRGAGSCSATGRPRRAATAHDGAEVDVELPPPQPWCDLGDVPAIGERGVAPPAELLAQPRESAPTAARDNGDARETAAPGRQAAVPSAP
jgi:hypothetical protein